VHGLLQSRLGRLAGLADPGVRLLDPAAGTMNFVRAAWRAALTAHRGGALLRRSFPRISFPCERPLFAALSALGRKLIGLHLLQDPRLRCGVGGEIDPEVWAYRLGGYRVLPQWLRARRKRALSAAETRHFRRTVEALRLTRDVQSRIEEVTSG